MLCCWKSRDQAQHKKCCGLGPYVFHGSSTPAETHSALSKTRNIKLSVAIDTIPELTMNAAALSWNLLEILPVAITYH